MLVMENLERLLREWKGRQMGDTAEDLSEAEVTVD